MTDAKLENDAEIRAARNGTLQELQNPSSYDPARFAREMRRVNALLR